MKLANKTVLVTGGSKGIGRACVLAFATEGANVIANYARDEAAAKTVVAEAEKLGVKAIALQADITKSDEVERMFAEISKSFSSIDVLINNAGIFDEDDNPENLSVFEKIFATNFLAQIRVTNHSRKMMKQGKIIFISSVHGTLGHAKPTTVAYSSMKIALDQYMKTLAKELAPDILVNTISPGQTHTPQWGEMSENYMKERAEAHLINRWIEADEIADGAVFLAKNDAVCGEILVIDGGMSLKVLG
ncbi:MAG: SDR family oxidoreductase [Candidatus Saccharibacteria bacterium]|nr:SDR family oxidoreductase [Candidatus Saccharibacteria bacterium]